MNRSCSCTLGFAALITLATPAFAEPPELASGSVLTSGMAQSLPSASLTRVQDVVCGGSVTAVLQCDGTWTGLGSNGNGLIRDMPRNAATMALGNAHGLALLDQTRLQTWGSPAGFVTQTPAGARTLPVSPRDPSSLAWAGVAAGGSHSAAWTDDGVLEMAGLDEFGQSTPPSGRRWETVALGGSHSVGIDKFSHEVVTWGLNSSGQCDVPTLQPGDPGYDPAAPNKPIRAIAVAAGLTHSAAITDTGYLVGWGSNSQGQIRFSPTYRSPNNGWVNVRAGALHTVALHESGRAEAWGDNSFNQCSLGGAGMRARNGVAKIAVGLYHSALEQSGDGCESSGASLTIVGANFYGETGTPNEPLLDIANGDGFFVGLRRDRTLIAWGNQTDTIQSVPGGTYATCAAGAQHAAAITQSGALVMWGNSADGRTLVPAGPGVLAANERWIRVACGTRHSVGLLTTGRVLAWGNNGSRQTSVPAGLLANAISAGAFFSAAVDAAGTPVIWGANAQGQLSPNLGTPALQSIAAGSDHWIGLTRTGSVIAKGNNANQQCSVPDLPSPALAIAASASTSACLLSDGAVRVWGKVRNLSGSYETALPPQLPNAMASGSPLRVHKIVLGGEAIATLVGHEYIADHRNGPYYTIQDAIDAAPVGGVVRVASGRWYPRQIRSDLTGLELRGDITLTAENPEEASNSERGTWLFGSVSVTNNPLHDNTSLTRSIITCWSNESPACVIRGFTFYGGNKGRIWPTNPASVVGGAIYIGNQFTAELCASSFLSGASPTIEMCRFVNGFAGYGGAIFMTRSRSNIRKCDFVGNYAQTMGGAVYAYAHDGMVSECNFINNVAVNSDGGAVSIHTIGDAFAWCNSNCSKRVGCEEITEGCTTRFDRGAPVFDRCVFTGNVSNGYGGAIAYSLGYRHPDATGPDGNPVRQLQLYDCLVYSNSAPLGGGGIAIGLEKLKSNPRGDCPFAADNGVELSGTQVQYNSSIGPGAFRYRDIMGAFVNLGGNSLTEGATGNPCPADIDGSGEVDFGDLAVVMLLMGTRNTGDLDDNGIVDYGDVVYLLLEFGPCR